MEIDKERNETKDPSCVSGILSGTVVLIYLPDRSIECQNAPNVPFLCHPAPEDWVSIDYITSTVLSANVDKGGITGMP